MTPTAIRVDCAREAQKEPEAQPAGIVATTSRSAGGYHHTIGARCWLAVLIRPC